MNAPELSTLRVVEMNDERSAITRKSIELIQDAIWDVHPTSYLLREIAYVRHGTTRGGAYHLLALLPHDSDEPIAAAAGIFLEAAQTGFVAYLAVADAFRGQ